jgi:hypothetical protein
MKEATIEVLKDDNETLTKDLEVATQAQSNNNNNNPGSGTALTSAHSAEDLPDLLQTGQLDVFGPGGDPRAKALSEFYIAACRRLREKHFRASQLFLFIGMPTNNIAEIFRTTKCAPATPFFNCNILIPAAIGYIQSHHTTIQRKFDPHQHQLVTIPYLAPSRLGDRASTCPQWIKAHNATALRSFDQHSSAPPPLIDEKGYYQIMFTQSVQDKDLRQSTAEPKAKSSKSMTLSSLSIFFDSKAAADHASELSINPLLTNSMHMSNMAMQSTSANSNSPFHRSYAVPPSAGLAPPHSASSTASTSSMQHAGPSASISASQAVPFSPNNPHALPPNYHDYNADPGAQSNGFFNPLQQQTSLMEQLVNHQNSTFSTTLIDLLSVRSSHMRDPVELLSQFLDRTNATAPSASTQLPIHQLESNPPFDAFSEEQLLYHLHYLFNWPHHRLSAGPPIYSTSHYPIKYGHDQSARNKEFYSFVAKTCKDTLFNSKSNIPLYQSVNVNFEAQSVQIQTRLNTACPIIRFPLIVTYSRYDDQLPTDPKTPTDSIVGAVYHPTSQKDVVMGHWTDDQPQAPIPFSQYSYNLVELSHPFSRKPQQEPQPPPAQPRQQPQQQPPPQQQPDSLANMAQLATSSYL